MYVGFSVSRKKENIFVLQMSRYFVFQIHSLILSMVYDSIDQQSRWMVKLYIIYNLNKLQPAKFKDAEYILYLKTHSNFSPKISNLHFKNYLFLQVLILENGAYGKRMAKMCEATSIPYRVESFAENRIVNPERVREILKTDNSFSLVGIIHCETSSGIFNPVQEVGQIVKHLAPGDDELLVKQDQCCENKLY